MAGPRPLFPEEQPATLSAEQEEYKRAIYNQLKPRQRKFIDRIGYENWDPFQAPKEPLDLRTDVTRRTLRQLLHDFMRDCDGEKKDAAWQAGASECALGVIRKDERFQGIFDFCIWYSNQLEREGSGK